MAQDIETDFKQLKNFIISSLPPDVIYPKIIKELELFESSLFESSRIKGLELENYKKFFENAGDYIFILSDGGIILSVNKAACKKYQRTYREFVGTSVADIDASGNKEAIMQNIQDLLQTGNTRFEAIHKSKNGKLFNVDVIAHKIIWNGTHAYINVCRNITQQKKLQQALNVSETKLKNIIDQIGDGIIIFEKNGTIVIWNSGAERITGINRKDALGRKFTDLYYKVQHGRFKSKQDANKVFQQIITSENKETFNKYFEYEIFVEDQGVKAIQAIAFPIELGEKNRLYGTVIRDITENKIFENTLRELNATKDKIFSVIGHDLRTPFNSIIGFTDMLLENFENFERSKIKQILQYINLSAKPTLDVLTNLLDWVNVQSGQHGINAEICQLKSLVQEVFEIMTPTATMKEISLSESVSEKYFVHADKRMLKSILQNLITNAIKFSHSKGKVEVMARKKLEYIEIEVADEGIGIDDARKAALFKLNTYSSTIGTLGEKGSGLGLVLCKEFVTRLGGKIRVVSNKGKGSRFFITLPALSTENSMNINSTVHV